MNWRSPLLVVGTIVIVGIGILSADSSRIQWVVLSGLSVLGILVFDNRGQQVASATYAFTFLGVFGFLIRALLEPTVEYFWRDLAGSVFLLSLCYEQESLHSTGNSYIRSSVGGAVVFFLLVLAQSVPFFPPTLTFILAALAILNLCLLDLFHAVRVKVSPEYGATNHALRFLVTGVASIFYSTVFMPSIAHEPAFASFPFVLPFLGAALSIWAWFLKSLNRRYILFLSSISLLVFWAAYSGEVVRVNAALAGVVIGSWTAAMVPPVRPKERLVKLFALKMLAWGIPGSLLFSTIVFMLIPSSNRLIQISSAVWCVPFLVYWVALLKLDWEGAEESLWTWRNALALALSAGGGVVLAVSNYYWQVFTMMWGGVQ